MSQKTIRQILFEAMPLEMNFLERRAEEIVFEDRAELPLFETSDIIKKGKLIRPGLLLLLYNGIKSDRPKSNLNEVINAAMSVEALHVATLLHDDVIDSATMRRNVPTINSIYGSKMAILLGDMLIAKSLSTVSQDKNIEIIDRICHAAFTITKGEMIQMNCVSDINMNISRYIKIISYKTASLFSTATEIGGLLANVDQNIVEAVKQFGHNIGLAFQIMDDVMDIWGNTTGKVLCNDLKEKKVTIPIIKFLEVCDQKERNALEHLFSSENSNPHNLELSIREVVEMLNKYDVKSLCVDIAEKYINDANTYLDSCITREYAITIHKIGNNIIFQN